MGFTNREIVALCGGHTLGRAFKERTGVCSHSSGEQGSTQYTRQKSIAKVFFLTSFPLSISFSSIGNWWSRHWHGWWDLIYEALALVWQQLFPTVIKPSRYITDWSGWLTSPSDWQDLISIPWVQTVFGTLWKGWENLFLGLLTCSQEDEWTGSEVDGIWESGNLSLRFCRKTLNQRWNIESRFGGDHDFPSPSLWSCVVVTKTRVNAPGRRDEETFLRTYFSRISPASLYLESIVRMCLSFWMLC